MTPYQEPGILKYMPGSVFFNTRGFPPFTGSKNSTETNHGIKYLE